MKNNTHALVLLYIVVEDNFTIKLSLKNCFVWYFSIFCLFLSCLKIPKDLELLASYRPKIKIYSARPYKLVSI